jgi:hypothetical protein
MSPKKLDFVGKNMSPREFEDLARKVMSQHFGVNLMEKKPEGFPKRFDLVSVDEKVVGDAKYLKLVHGTKYPPAKMMEITGHVWLLEKVNAETRFLVFGNQRDVPELWLEKYGNYKHNVDFYFLSNDCNLEKLE